MHFFKCLKAIIHCREENYYTLIFSMRFKPVELDPLTIWNILYYFSGNYLRSGTDKKVDLENKERPNSIPIYILY